MKNKGFTLSLEDTLLEKCPHSPPPLNSFSTKVNSKMNHNYEHQIFIEDPRVKSDKSLGNALGFTVNEKFPPYFYGE